MDAKKEFLNSMKKEMADKIGEKFGGEKIKGMKKVAVMAPSEEGLEEGLSAAQKILKSKMMNNGDFDEENGMESEVPVEGQMGEMEKGKELPVLWDELKMLSQEDLMKTKEYIDGLLNSESEDSSEMDELHKKLESNPFRNY